MKNQLLVLIIIGLAFNLTGCGQSAEEKIKAVTKSRNATAAIRRRLSAVLT